jgi:CRISPR-associated protein Cas1
VTQERTATIPVEDISVLILESRRSAISTRALAELAQAGVAVITCDEKHLPNGLLCTYGRHSRLPSIAQSQLDASLPLRKRLWQRLVVGKIENQSRVLDLLGRDGAVKMREYAERVTSGDTQNMEAVAARYYFRRLMPYARRHSGVQLDSAFDYGYSVVRAAIARSVVAHGLLASFGLHHAGGLNAFNLADDLLEPFRPAVDLWAVLKTPDVDTKDGRRYMVAILNQPCLLGGRRFTILSSTESVAVSLARAYHEREHCELGIPLVVMPGQESDRLLE